MAMQKVSRLPLRTFQMKGARHLMSAGLSVLICKMEIIIPCLQNGEAHMSKLAKD